MSKQTDPTTSGPWKFPAVPAVLERQHMLAVLRHALQSSQPLTKEQRSLLIDLVEKQITPTAARKAAEADLTMWRDWRLAVLDVIATGRNSRRKRIAAAFPASADVTAITIKNAAKRFKVEAEKYVGMIAASGGKDALQAEGVQHIESLAYDFGADEQKLLDVFRPD